MPPSRPFAVVRRWSSCRTHGRPRRVRARYLPPSLIVARSLSVLHGRLHRAHLLHDLVVTLPAGSGPQQVGAAADHDRADDPAAALRRLGLHGDVLVPTQGIERTCQRATLFVRSSRSRRTSCLRRSFSRSILSRRASVIRSRARSPRSPMRSAMRLAMSILPSLVPGEMPGGRYPGSYPRRVRSTPPVAARCKYRASADLGTETTSPTTSVAGGPMLAAAASVGRSSRVPTTVRCSSVHAHCTTAAGVDPAGPPR